MKLLLISALAMGLYLIDAMLLRFARLTFVESMVIIGCAMCAMIVWVTAMNAYIKQTENKNDKH
jgi:hypothetical protein